MTIQAKSRESSNEPTVDKNGNRVRDMFAQIAPRYDLMNHLLSLGIDIRWRKKVVRRLRLDQDLPVLDCCTGTGDLALMLAKRLQGSVEVVGTDFCSQMLDIANKKHLAAHADWPVRFLEADSQDLPFDDNTFQAVTVAFGLRNVQDTAKGLCEMVRVCAPGGQIAVLEFSKPTAFGLKQAYQYYFQKILPKVGQKMARNNHSAYEYLPRSVIEFPDGQALSDLMEKCGLRSIRFFPYTFGVVTLYLGEVD